MKKVLPKKARIVIASSLVILFLTVVVMSVVLIFSALTYSQRVGTIFTMTYKAPTPHYPQTYVGDSLNTTLENLLSSSSSSLVATGNKYTTDANGTTKVCLEYTYNGHKYARLVGAMPYRSSITWLNSTINTYSLTTTTITEGANYWFKVEPIEFDTFTGITGIDGTVKMAKMILGSQVFDSSSNDWSTSVIKTYLNGTFLTESGIDKIAKNRTYYSTTYSDSSTLTDNGTQVTTKIWLPSCGEIQEMYGTASTSNTEIRKVATDFARATCTNFYESDDKDINETYEFCGFYNLRSAKSANSTGIWVIVMTGTVGSSTNTSKCNGFSPAFMV